jgi:hypothetical protein
VPTTLFGLRRQEQEATRLRAGGSVFIGADPAHATFNDGDETAQLAVIVGPARDTGIGGGLVDVSGEAVVVASLGRPSAVPTLPAR